MFKNFDLEFQTWKIDWAHAYNFPNTQLNVRLITDKSSILIHHKVSMGDIGRHVLSLVVNILEFDIWAERVPKSRQKYKNQNDNELYSTDCVFGSVPMHIRIYKSI